MNPADPALSSDSIGFKADRTDERPSTITYRRAVSPADLDQVYRLNHAIFAHEVGQHRPDASGRLVDKFDAKNVYYLALRQGEVVGMVAVHDQAPFSIAARLPGPESIARLAGRPLEVRLLSVRPGLRQGLILFGLLWQVRDHAQRHGHTHLLISGVAARVSLYERLGFSHLGPPVAEGSIALVPMMLDLTAPPVTYRRSVDRYRGRLGRLDQRRGLVSLLPGPVEVSRQVANAFRARPVSHRDPEFIALYEQVRTQLGSLVGGHRVALFAGGGTLANDVVLASLATTPGLRPGLILTNGEFGERLTRQASRFGLKFEVLSWPWGKPWDLDAVAARLDHGPALGWVQAVHLETSTGMLNDLPGLVARTSPRGVLVCADIVSSLGAVAVDLTGVHLAAAASGKSLAAFAGLGIVFADPSPETKPTPRGPVSLDLSNYLQTKGPPSTVASPVVTALHRALRVFETQPGATARYHDAAEVGRQLRAGLRGLGLTPTATESWAAPVVTSFPLPAGWSDNDFRAGCQAIGFEVATASDYLRHQRWAQIATMGVIRIDQIDELLAGLARMLDRPWPLA